VVIYPLERVVPREGHPPLLRHHIIQVPRQEGVERDVDEHHEHGLGHGVIQRRERRVGDVVPLGALAADLTGYRVGTEWVQSGDRVDGCK
jgi:hypothetical protein